MRVSYHVGLGETTGLGDTTSPSKITRPLQCPPICSSKLSTARSTLTTITCSPCCYTPSGLSRVSSTVRRLPTYAFLASSLTTRNSRPRRPHELRRCPGGYKGETHSPPRHVEPVPQRSRHSSSSPEGSSAALPTLRSSHSCSRRA